MSLSHVDSNGQASMVDVSEKSITARTAWATGSVFMSPLAFELVRDNGHKKGDVLAVARIAGIQAAKKTPDLIPLCHPLMLSKVQIDFELESEKQAIHIFAMCKLAGQTGVEMEALTAASVAALTIFDMCKAVDPAMRIQNIQVLEKQGGKSGHWQRNKAGE